MRNLASGSFAFLLHAGALCAACSSSGGPVDGGSPDAPVDAPKTDGAPDGSTSKGGTGSGAADRAVPPPNDGATDASDGAALDAGADADAGPTVACVKGDLLCLDGGVVLCGPGGDWDGGMTTCPNGTTCSGNRCSWTLVANAGPLEVASKRPPSRGVTSRRSLQDNRAPGV